MCRAAPSVLVVQLSAVQSSVRSTPSSVVAWSPHLRSRHADAPAARPRSGALRPTTAHTHRRRAVTKGNYMKLYIDLKYDFMREGAHGAVSSAPLRSRDVYYYARCVSGPPSPASAHTVRCGVNRATCSLLHAPQRQRGRVPMGVLRVGLGRFPLLVLNERALCRAEASERRAAEGRGGKAAWCGGKVDGCGLTSRTFSFSSRLITSIRQLPSASCEREPGASACARSERKTSCGGVGVCGDMESHEPRAGRCVAQSQASPPAHAPVAAHAPLQTRAAAERVGLGVPS